MSDLQCPARFLMLGGVDDTTADSLRDERVALVYDARGRDEADPVLAGRLEVPARRLEGTLSLVDVRARRPEALALLEDVADLHRGETVVVLAAGGSGERLEVSLDADGVALR